MTGVAKFLSRKATSPEDYGRGLRENGVTGVGSSRACDFLQQYVEQHDGGPFDGVLGFSEGASLAANLILRQSTEKGFSQFKFASFICAVPTFRSNNDDIILTDETDKRIKIPTAYIVGSKDLGYQGSRVWYNLCHQPYASIFDHRGTHTISWDLASTQGTAREICSVVERACSVPPVKKGRTLSGDRIRAQNSVP